MKTRQVIEFETVEEIYNAFKDGTIRDAYLVFDGESYIHFSGDGAENFELSGDLTNMRCDEMSAALLALNNIKIYWT